ncbi:MAG: response regulator transcription factor [Candidatus Promineifilaceae bacterium]|nr:response regulator transcription factor [Candidatus Promineifilaceae bacterium]
MNRNITILIIDSHPSVRSGLQALIETSPGMSVIGDTYSCESAVYLAHMHRPNVIILDTKTNQRDGIGMLRAVRRASPQSKILVLTDNINSTAIEQAIAEGAHGYLLKDPLSADIAAAIHDILDGKLILHDAVANILAEVPS